MSEFSVWSDLDRKLAARGVQIRGILNDLDALESDVRRVECEGAKIFYCVDFVDLFSYLTLTSEELGPGTTASANEGPEEYARMLMFNRLQAPLLLLPPYYMEFRDHVAKAFLSRRDSEYQQEAWVADIVRELDTVRQSTVELASFLGGGGETEVVEAVDRDKIGRLADTTLRGLQSALERMHELTLTGGFLGRFTSLVERGRLMGLRDIGLVADTVAAPRGSVYYTAIRRLNELKPNRRGHPNNERDAEAISLVADLNRRFSSGGKVFILVSSAHTMRLVLEAVNEARLDDAVGPLELRTVDFWWLWYAVAGGGAQARDPSFEEVLEFKRKLRGELEEWAAGNDRLRSSLRKSPKSDASLERDVRGYLKGSDAFLSEIQRPLFGVDWKLAALDDLLTPVAKANKAVVSAVGRIRILLDQVGRVESPGELETIVLAVLRTLEDLIGHIQKLAKEEAGRAWS